MAFVYRSNKKTIFDETSLLTRTKIETDESNLSEVGENEEKERLIHSRPDWKLTKYLYKGVSPAKGKLLNERASLTEEGAKKSSLTLNLTNTTIPKTE